MEIRAFVSWADNEIWTVEDWVESGNSEKYDDCYDILVDIDHEDCPKGDKYVCEELLAWIKRYNCYTEGDFEKQMRDVPEWLVRYHSVYIYH
jgi:hypothetical protein